MSVATATAIIDSATTHLRRATSAPGVFLLSTTGSGLADRGLLTTPRSALQRSRASMATQGERTGTTKKRLARRSRRDHNERHARHDTTRVTGQRGPDLSGRTAPCVAPRRARGGNEVAGPGDRRHRVLRPGRHDPHWAGTPRWRLSADAPGGGRRPPTARLALLESRHPDAPSSQVARRTRRARVRTRYEKSRYPVKPTFLRGRAVGPLDAEHFFEVCVDRITPRGLRAAAESGPRCGHV